MKNTKRRSYHLPSRSIELLEKIAEHYGHGSLTSALAGCVQHVYMSIPASSNPQSRTESIDETEETEDDHEDYQPHEDDI